MLVDEDHSGVQFVHKPLAFRRISGPGARSKSEACVIRNLDGVIDVSGAEERSNRTEKLLTIRRRICRDVRQNRGGVEEARAVERCRAGGGTSSGLKCSCNVGMERADAACGREGTDVGSRVEWVSDGQRLHSSNKLALELFRDLLRDDKALGGNAGLSVVQDACPHSDLDRSVQVGCGHHDERIAAAQLKNHLLDAFGRSHRDLDAGILASGDGGRDNAGIAEKTIDLLGSDQ